jgi:hypothetical protein
MKKISSETHIPMKKSNFSFLVRKSCFFVYGKSCIIIHYNENLMTWHSKNIIKIFSSSTNNILLKIEWKDLFYAKKWSKISKKSHNFICIYLKKFCIEQLPFELFKKNLITNLATCKKAFGKIIQTCEDPNFWNRCIVLNTL